MTETLHTIGETAAIFGVSVDTIRRWERRGLITGTRTLKGHRRFSQTEIDRLLTRAA